ncbi:MAG: wax ester/triacylglycerol synthase family O-acyltransferase [Alphaproteobacteria bacterium]|nr:wax ester/triacylglycerol synthase family O-acyltransferase [Alphaproteobacteria bacterium]
MPRRERMARVDAAWLHMETPDNLMMITGVMWFEVPLDRAAVAEVVRERLVERFPRFRDRVVEHRLGGPAWAPDPDFSLEHHLVEVRLPQPGDHAALEALVDRTLSTALDREHPLWQVMLVQDYRGGSALLTRIHHCIADGIALARVLLSLADPAEGVETDDVLTPDLEDDHGHSRLRALGLQAREAVHGAARAARTLAHEGKEVVRNPGEVLDAGRYGAEAVAKLLTLPDELPTCLRGALSVRKRAAWSDSFTLAEVKRVGKAIGATVNDVLLTTVTGALRRYMLERDGPVVDVTTFVPVNLRPLDGPIALGNRFGLVFLTLPVSVHTPLGRLHALKARMDAIKDSPEALVAYGILAAMGQAPAAVEGQIVRLFGQKASAVMTNVPGPRQPLRLAGEQVAGVMFWVPQSGGVGLGVSIFSYAGKVLLGINADAAILPDPHEIIRGAEAEFAALAALTEPAA